MSSYFRVFISTACRLSDAGAYLAAQRFRNYGLLVFCPRFWPVLCSAMIAHSSRNLLTGAQTRLQTNKFRAQGRLRCGSLGCCLALTVAWRGRLGHGLSNSRRRISPTGNGESVELPLVRPRDVAEPHIVVNPPQRSGVNPARALFIRGPGVEFLYSRRHEPPFSRSAVEPSV